MSATLVARGVAAGYGARSLFHDLDLTVSAGEVVGLVGPNGAGKSTLLLVLSGRLRPEAGTVELVPRDAAVGYLPQEVPRVPGQTVADYLGEVTGVAAATYAFEVAAAALANPDSTADAAGGVYDHALQSYLGLGAADYDARLPQAAAEVGLDVPLGQPMTSLSGGQAARVNLMALLLARFDVLALDEPTNDLDLAGLQILERFVAGTRAGIIVVSHDREFLIRTVTRVLDFDPALQRVSEYSGGYESYLVERMRARSAAQAAYEEYSQTKEELLDRARRARATAARGAKYAQRAYATNKVDKVTRDMMVDGATSGASAARRAERAVERLTEVQEPRSEWQLRFEVAAAPPSGQVVALLDGAVARLGSFTLGPVTLEIARGERVVITGANGSGKTTLLGVLTGDIPAVSGTARLGAGVRVGRVAQSRDRFAGPDSPLDVLREELALPPEQVRTLLAKYALAGEDALRPGLSLSAGERTRAAMAMLAAQGVNLLVLDEPTNHLDLAAIEQLEAALGGYGGTLLLVSHDRRLLAAVRADRHVLVTAGRVSELDTWSVDTYGEVE